MTQSNLYLNTLFNVEGYVVVVTGGGTGIGSWIAEAFVQNGATVYITGRRKDILDDTADRLNSLSGATGHAVPFTADVTSRDDVNNLVKFVSQREHSVDLVVNNAAAIIYENPTTYKSDIADLQSTLYSTTQDVWTSQYAANTWGPHLVTTAFLHLLAKAAAKGNGRGSVIIMSSVAARWWNPHINIPAYSASKAAVEQISKVLSAKLYPYGIRVNVISPGSYPTDMNKTDNPSALSNPANDSNIPLGRSGSAEDIVGAIIWLASRAGAYVTGQIIDVDGGLNMVANGTNKISP